MYYTIGLLSLLALGCSAAPTDKNYFAGRYIIYSFLFSLYITFSHIEDLPKCSTEEDQLGECVKQLFNTLTPRLKDGNPELRIEPYEPLHLNRTSFQYSSGTVNGRITVRNAKIYGFSSNRAKEVSVKLNGDKVKLRLVTQMPKLNIVGSYKADMQVNQLQLKPKGEFNVTLCK